ncbi:MAG TPA: hypothetical protein VGE72_09875 [Azospirillum sp.]
MASHHDDMDDADFLAEVRESIDRASKPLPEMQAAAHVFVLRQSANDWVEVTSADWLAHRHQGAPLAGFCGDIHVASTVVSEGQIVNIRTSYRRLDKDGRLVALLDDLPYEEQQERDRLMVDANLSEAGQRRYHELCEKEWKASLPPANQMRRLLRHLPLPIATWTAASRHIFKEIGLDPAGWLAEAQDGRAN